MIRDAIEDGFERWGRWVCRHPRTVAALALAVGIGLAAALPNLRVDVSDEAFLAGDDPDRLLFDRYREDFGRSGQILIAVETAETEQIFDLAFLERLRQLHRALELEVPQVDEVTSLLNARYTHGNDDELIVEDLIADWPRGPADIEALRERVAANPLYRNLLISEDARLTIVNVKLAVYSPELTADEALDGFEDSFDNETEPADTAGAQPQRPFLSGEEANRSVAAARAVVERFDAEDFQLRLAGGPVIDSTLQSTMQRDIANFVSLSVCVIAVLLFLVFRSLPAVFMALGVVLLALASTFGCMALADVAVTLPIQVLPSFLLAVGICDSVHVLTIFFVGLRAGRSRRDAIARALGHSGLAILMTTLTTAGGLVSFAAASLQPLADFGVFGPLGVFFALLFTLTLLPALLALVPLRAPQNDCRALGTDAIDRFLGWCSRTAVARSGLVLALAAGLIAFSLFGIARLRFSQDTMEWLPESHPTRTATEFMDRKLRGSLPLEVLLETDRENAFHDPALLHALDELHAYADSMRLGEIRVGKTLSLIDPLKETNRALHENRPEFHSIPDDRGLVAQEMLLFENAGSDDLNDFVDSQFSRAALTLRVSWCDAMNGTLFIDELERNFRRILPADVHIHMTGEMTLFNRIFRAVIASMARSYTIAFLVVTPLMMLLLWSVRTGLLSMLPNVLPVLTILGLMGWADLPLDFSTMMVGAILLGVAVDDTIHFMHAFRGERRRCGETASAIHAALHSTGRAMLSTSIVLVGGFVVFTLATMTNIVVVGILTSVAVVVAFLADVLLAPALLVRAPFASGCLKREGLRRLTCLRREAEEW